MWKSLVLPQEQPSPDSILTPTGPSNIEMHDIHRYVHEKLCKVQAERLQPPSILSTSPAPLLPGCISNSSMPAPPQPHCMPRPAKSKQSKRVPQPSSGTANIVSVGTVGHPLQCGPPCKYVKRKGGCLDGAKCPNCHSCFWKRSKVYEDSTRDEDLPALANSHDASPVESPPEHTYVQSSTVQLPLETLTQQFFIIPNPLLAGPMEFTKAGGLPSGGVIGNTPRVGISHAHPQKLKPAELVADLQSLEPIKIPTPWQFLSTELPAWPMASSDEESAPAEMQAGEPTCHSKGSIGHPFTCGNACKYFRKAKGCKDGLDCDHCHLCPWNRYCTAKDKCTDSQVMRL